MDKFIEELYFAGKITPAERHLAQYLRTFHTGHTNKIVSSKLFTFGSDVKIRSMVNSLRRNGVPVCATEQGYYYAVTSGEIKQTVDSLKSRIQGIQAAIEGLTDTYYEFKTNERADG